MCVSRLETGFAAVNAKSSPTVVSDDDPGVEGSDGTEVLTGLLASVTSASPASTGDARGVSSAIVRKDVQRKNQAFGTGGTAADAFDPEAFDTARTRLAPGPNFGLAYLTSGLERIEAGAAGFARAPRNGVSNNNGRGAATPTTPPTYM